MNLKIYYWYNLCSNLNPMIFCKYSVSCKYEKLCIPFRLKKDFHAFLILFLKHKLWKKKFFIPTNIYFRNFTYFALLCIFSHWEMGSKNFWYLKGQRKLIIRYSVGLPWIHFVLDKNWSMLNSFHFPMPQ